MKSYFLSRDPAYRSPCGAVAVQTKLHFKIALPRALRCSAAYLCVHCEENGYAYDSAMYWCGMDGTDGEFWECHFTPPTEGIYWYRFQLQTVGGIRRIGREFGGEGKLDSEKEFQLTVYSTEYSTPEWLVGGTMYQIFPDRFARSGGQKANVPSGRILREDWWAQPEWRPDPQGKTLNNDYFGGDLEGIRQHLSHLQELGVTCLYLNPIFEAHSNHRYNTADYCRIDPLLGTEEEFARLCREAKERGIHILLDGVFSHTGSDSVYFNQEKRYDSVGAYHSKESPYYHWYTFHPWPDKYECWWGVLTLPEVNEAAPDFEEFITGKDGIAARWMREGISGWRLDVADELPDSFLDAFRRRVKEENPDALVLGEVWEDASSKISYGHRRRYLLGKQLDSVMNYPFRTAILEFFTRAKAEDAMEIIASVVENYPPQALHILMNSLGTHDTPRALTMLGGTPAEGRGREWQSREFLTEAQRERGLRRLRAAAVMQYTLPGVPCLYYGDEAGMEGYGDPFNRGCYPWGDEDEGLLEFFRQLGALRRQVSCLRRGKFVPIFAQEGVLIYGREDETDRLCCCLNATKEEVSFVLPEDWRGATELLAQTHWRDGTVTIPGEGAVLLHQIL